MFFKEYELNDDDDYIFGLDYGTGDTFIDHTPSKVKETKETKGRGILISCHQYNEEFRAPKII